MRAALGLRATGIALEPMDTGAACRTYNVLVAEGRRVAAALIPPSVSLRGAGKTEHPENRKLVRIGLPTRQPFVGGTLLRAPLLAL